MIAVLQVSAQFSENWRSMIKFSRSTNYPGGKVLYVLQFTYISVNTSSSRPSEAMVLPWHLVSLGVLAGLAVPSHPKIRSLKLVLTLF